MMIEVFGGITSQPDWLTGLCGANGFEDFNSWALSKFQEFKVPFDLITHILLKNPSLIKFGDPICCNTFLTWDDCVWLCFSTKGCVCDFGSSLVHKPVVQRLMVVKFGRVTSWERCRLLPTAVKDAPCCAVAMQLKNDALHKHACTIAQTSLASTIRTVGALDFFLFFSYFWQPLPGCFH